MEPIHFFLPRLHREAPVSQERKQCSKMPARFARKIKTWIPGEKS